MLFGAVVNLIADDRVVATIGRSHGLRAGFAQVEDCQSAMRKSAAATRIEPQARVIGAARMHVLAHAQQCGAVHGCGRG